MAELILIRHAQASFGAADYDVLSERGHRQSAALGLALKAHGTTPAAVFRGEMRRHRETLDGVTGTLGVTAEPAILPGLNEFDFRAVLTARYGEEGPPGLHDDRKTHFRNLRETVLMWQRDEIDGVPERFGDFQARVLGAVDTMTASGADSVMAVSSGGPIALVVATLLETPLKKMIELQLQMKNCAVTRIVFTPTRRFLHTFNETPHIDAETTAEYLTYS
ncbi:histidine phosphatase family protein [Acuticoccus sediminis]|uniref:Histidine phosphatase family protein n=1 Tax=Acuticoccus sediminis TaxID=2184697 RepID=A0A8B2NG40_9HYPH|nr:histidine phosphatase family protein [Acuticoccus sediminis]RAH98220.1 histidine phosphatase family protein [Acuticoccus sediminis]